ncbi:glycosyltransferase family 39 protein [Flavobacterium sp.]|jgi:uncharacterized membrane protein|uniref:glycosyltransferase family 39 protein n=2 Tax=Flavobacterium TaxID=237 RepID=UPI002587FA01|nr:glycosyltransferase family 39 protein [Flavobacterium sp.]
MNKVLNFIKENKFLVVILLIAAILRFYKINLQSLWMDEIYTMNITNPDNSFGTIVTEVNNREGFPYLYFLLLKILHTIFGYSAIVTRGLSAFFGILSVYAISKLGEKIYSKKAGLFAALILAFSEYGILISQEARPYSFYVLGVIVSFYAMITFLKLPNRRNAIRYGLLAGLLLNVNFFGLFNLFTQFILVVIYLLLTEKSKRIDFIKKCLLAATITVVLFLPNIYKLSTLFGVVAAWIPSPSNESLTILLKEFLGNSESTLFFFTPILMYFLITVFKKENNQTNKEEIINDKEIFSFTILFAWVFIFVFIILLNSYLNASLLIPRYFTSILPAIILIIGIGISMIKSSVVRTIFSFGLITLMIFNLFVVRGHYRGTSKTQFREASQIIIDKNKTKEPVYTSLKYWYDYYLKDNFTLIEKPNLETIINEMIANPSLIKPFWYTDAHGRPFTLSDNAQQFVNTNFYIDESFDGFDAWTKHFILLKDAKKDIDISKFSPFQTYNGDQFGYSIESFENQNGIITASGWAYFDGQDAKDSEITVILIKDTKSISLPTQKVNRPDVTTYFKSNFNLANSGFSSTINLADLEKGTYKIGVYIVNTKEGKEGLNISDKIVDNQ